MIAADEATFSANAVFPHRRTCGDDAQVSFLEPRRHPIEIGEARRDTGDARTGRLTLLDLLEGLPQNVLDPDKAFALMAVRNLEDLGLGDVEKFFYIALALVIHVANDRRGPIHQPTEQGFFANDVRVVLDVGRGRNGIHQRSQVVQASRCFELAGLLEFLRDRDGVDDVATLEKPRHRMENPTVSFAVERCRIDLFDRTNHCLAIDHHTPKYRRLSLQGGGHRAIPGGRMGDWVGQRRQRGGQR